MTQQIARRWLAAGRHVRCGHCGSETFWRRATLLNSRGMTFLGYDWANRAAHALVCTVCGHVEWFLGTIQGEGTE